MRKYRRESYDLNTKMMAARNGMRLYGDELAPGYKYFMSDTFKIKYQSI